jgi:hypothetical protein
MKNLKLTLDKISAHIRLLSDDSGRFYYLDSMESSYSTLYLLLNYFIMPEDENDSSSSEVPVDAYGFLQLLKRVGVPAQYLATKRQRR